MLHEEPIYMEGEKDGISVEIALQYNEAISVIFIHLPIIFIRMKAEHMNLDLKLH